MGIPSDLASWVKRARRLIPHSDRKVLLSPPRLLARFVGFAVRRGVGVAGHATADDIRARDPEFVDLVLDLFKILGRYYFRFRSEGMENVPATGPVLFVGNHSGGLVPIEGFLGGLAIRERFGTDRVAYALVHDFIFEDPILRKYAGKLGMLRAGHESAHHAFAAGASVLVYPGSDLDTYRSFRDRNKVVLGGRKGFIKCALREGVPIVPVVTAGTAEQFIVLTRGDRLARLLRAHRWARAEVLPIILSVPWGITHGFVPYLPLPTQVTISALPPMRWPEYGPADADDPEVLDRCYREVEAAMQVELDRLTKDRRFLLGPPTPLPELSVETDIAAPPQVVWDVLTDLAHYGDWNPFIREITGSLDVGGSVKINARAPSGVPLRFSAEVIGRTEARELRWRGHVGAPWLGAGEHAFLLEPTGQGHTRFVQRERFAGVLPRVTQRLLESQTRAAFDSMNQALKARAERVHSWMLSEPPAKLDPYGARIEAVGAKLPEHRLTTHDLMASTRHRTKIDLERLTGIRERRICGPDEDTLTLAIGAARDCLSRSRYTGADLDMVITTSITRHDGKLQHRFEPPLSLSVKEAIGASQATSFDISNACAGMLTGVFLLNDLVRRGVIRRGMVVSGEHITQLGTNAARSIRNILSLQLASLTLGDAGAAVIVDRTSVDHPGIAFTGFTTLAEHSRLCIGLPSWRAPGAQMYTRAREIHKVAMADGPPLIKEILDGHGMTFGQVDWFIPHQTSVRAVRGGERALAEKLGEHAKNVVVTVDEYGNTASTTLFLALHKYLGEGKFAVGDRIMLLSVASGLEIGVALLVMDELRETHGHTH